MAKSKWTCDTLKEHYDAVLRDREAATDQTRDAMEYRLQGMNEFRAEMSDRAANYLTRKEAVAFFSAGAAVAVAIVAIVHP